MKIQLIADSCCDVTPAMRKTLDLLIAPLKITIDGVKEYIDDASLNVKALLADMKASKQPVSTAAPSPEDYASLMRAADASVVVTLSSNLSGSYNAALAGRDLVLEEHPEKKIAVFDSKSATAGETLLVLEAHDRIAGGMDFDALCEYMKNFIDHMRTFFVLEDLSNLVKNGRIPKMAGFVGSLLMLRPIMGENGNGEIIPIEKVRGTRQAITKLIAMVAERTAHLPPASIAGVVTQCNCPDRAADFRRDLLAACPAFSEILIAPTGGISTCYANDGGVVVAFPEVLPS